MSASPTSSVLHLFNTSILAEEEDDTQLTKDVKRNILAYLNLLDPRFRTTYIKKEMVEQVTSRAVKEIKALKDQKEDTPSGAAATGPVLPPEEKS